MRKKYYSFKFPLFVLFLIYLPSLSAQVTKGFNYQAVARDALGEILPDTDIELRMSITVDPNAPGVVYSEEHLVTSDAFGMVNVVIGEGTPNNGAFDEIDWDGNEHFLMIRMTFDGIDADLPPVKFQAVPYAKVAATTSDKLWQETGDTIMSIYYNDGPVGVGTLEPQRKLEVAQSFEDVFLRLHSQGSPAGAAMIELIRGTEFSATDWRLGNTGYGFAFEVVNDNFTTLTTNPDYNTAFHISNNRKVGVNTTSPEYTLDVSSNPFENDDYNTIRIKGYENQLTGASVIPAVQFTYEGVFEPDINRADYRLENDGTRFRLERSFNDFETSNETMLSVNDNGNMNMHFHRIVDMADPTQGDHAVTLSYMNSAIDDALATIMTDTDPLELSTFSGSSMFLPQCANYCEDLTTGGHDDWRIPTISELARFFGQNYTNLFVWSSTPAPSSFTGGNNTIVYRFFIHNNHTGLTSHDLQNQLRCRCVRGEK